MQKKIKYIILLVLIITLSITNIAYAQIQIKTSPIGPSVTDLKNKQDILDSFEQIKIIRSNSSIINIREDLTTEQLQSIDANIQNYVDQMTNIKLRLRQHKVTYAKSFSDVFFAEQIIFIADTYNISFKHQQLLVRSLQNNIDEAKKKFLFKL